jgi:hypothetical protein
MVLSYEILDAVDRGDIRGVEAALAAGDDVNDVTPWTGMTLLNTVFFEELPHEDARTGMIRCLLENGADPHAHFYDACVKGNADQVRLFVEHGVNVNARNERDNLPLSCALRNTEHSIEVCRVLLRHGARLDAPCRTTGTSARLLILLEGMGLPSQSVVDSAIRFAKRYPIRQPATNLLVAVRDAGSWHRYCVEPSVKLLALRHLSLAGRAVPPPNLARLFSTRTSAARTPSKRPRTVAAPPTDIFKLILGFWGGNHP